MGKIERGLSLKDRRLITQERQLMQSGTSGCLLVLHTSSGATFCGDALIETNGKSGGSGIIRPSEAADQAVGRLAEAWRAGGAVDEHLADQLVVFMALAASPSRLLCPAKSSITSLHLATAVHFAALLTKVTFSFRVLRQEHKAGHVEEASISSTENDTLVNNACNSGGTEDLADDQFNFSGGLITYDPSQPCELPTLPFILYCSGSAS